MTHGCVIYPIAIEIDVSKNRAVKNKGMKRRNTMYVLAVWFVAIAILIWLEHRSGRARHLGH